MTVPILDSTRGWECPSCGFQHVTRDPRPVTPTHPCARQHGLSVPLVRVYSNAGLRSGLVRHVAVERDDYIGGERGMVRDARGRVVSAVRTERADGSNDTRVHAPVAHATVRRNL